jgi:transcriptional regulator with XRE-family HTH domain
MSPLGQKIKNLREQRGWDQEEMAHRARLAGSTVSKIECGRHKPRLDTLEAMAEALGVSVAELLAARLQPAVSAA